MEVISATGAIWNSWLVNVIEGSFYYQKR
jgi:hypothetical protein